MSLLLKACPPVQKPGSRGGHFYYDRNGCIQYGLPPGYSLHHAVPKDTLATTQTKNPHVNAFYTHMYTGPGPNLWQTEDYERLEDRVPTARRNMLFWEHPRGAIAPYVHGDEAAHTTDWHARVPQLPWLPGPTRKDVQDAEDRVFEDVAHTAPRDIQNKRVVLDRMAQALQRYCDESELAVRVPADVIPAVLEHGLQNQHENGRTHGGIWTNALEVRRQLEHTFFGIPEDAPGHTYPVYGYLEPRDGPPNVEVEMYGDAKLVLKPHVRQRTTVTAQDSLGSAAIPCPIDRCQASAIGTKFSQRDAFGGVHQRSTGSVARVANAVEDYVEAQIHNNEADEGRVRAGDIERVDFTGEAPSREATDALERAGIPWRHTPPRERDSRPPLPAGAYSYTRNPDGSITEEEG